MKKKIMIVHHSGLLGGAGISLYNNLLTLKEMYNIVTYIPDKPSDLLYFISQKDFNLKTFSHKLGKITYYSGGNNIINPKFWFHLLKIPFQMKKWESIIKTENPDLLIVNSKVLCWFGLISKKLNIKSICSVRETVKGKSKNIINSIIRKLLDNFSAVTFLSKYDSKQINLSKATKIIAPDYINIDKYSSFISKDHACKEINLKENSFKVLFVGGINKLKGIDISIDAMKYLKEYSIELVIAGHDNGTLKFVNPLNVIKYINKLRAYYFTKKIKRNITKNSLTSKISFIGTQTNMPMVYSCCDVLIFPMKKPHQARPAFEIGTQKKTVIISDFDNIKEFFEDGHNCLLFKPNDSKSLSNAIKRLYIDERLLELLGLNNYETTIKYHSEDTAMLRLKKEIERLTS